MEGNLLHMEKIEAYILNKMDSSQKIAFEQLLEQDPLVKQEFEIQKDIIQHIQHNRKTALKARLNKIDVSSSGWTNTAKVAASLLLISSIGAGVYLLNFEEKTTNTNTIELTNTIEQSEKLTEQNTLVKSENTSEQTEPVSTDSEKKQIAKSKVAPPSKSVPQTTEVTAPVHIPQISDNFADADNIDKGINLPTADVAKTVDTKAKLNISLIDDAGEIAYQYYNNKLFLYGKFSKEKYEILEFNNGNKKEMYLYFNSQYYYINPNTLEKTQLQSIKNQEIQNQLELIREK